MKKITGMLIIVSLLLCGCVQKIEDPAEASAKYPWIIATDSPKDTVTGLFAHKFAEEVESLSNGSIHMEVYENGTLGSDRELIESCMGQDIPFVLQNTAPRPTLCPDWLFSICQLRIQKSTSCGKRWMTPRSWI